MSKTFIRTHCGHNFDFANMRTNPVMIEDIAHALSNACRFAGHVDEFYSVAQHSVLVSKLCFPQDALAGLLHDGHEAYVGDMATPLKGVVGGYREVEEKAKRLVLTTFGLKPVLPPSVYNADAVALATEGRDLFKNGWPYQSLAVAPHPDEIIPLPPAQAKRLFLRRWRQLMGKPH